MSLDKAGMWGKKSLKTLILDSLFSTFTAKELEAVARLDRHQVSSSGTRGTPEQQPSISSRDCCSPASCFDTPFNTIFQHHTNHEMLPYILSALLL